MAVRFTVTKGPDKGKIFTINAGDMPLMGRSSKADITIRDMGISRIHCQLKNDGQKCTIEDLNSKNGTLLNGRRITQASVLHHEDTIRIGTTIIKVDTSPEETAKAAAEMKLNLFADEEEELDATEAAPKTQAPQSRFQEAAMESESIKTPPSPAAPEGRKTDENAGAMIGAFDEWLDEVTPARKPMAESPKPAIEEKTPVPSAEKKETGPVPHVEIGAVIAGCRVERQIGSDALSAKYLAKQLSMDRPVELRILSRELMKDQRAVERFTQAARAAGRLTHPHILQIYDAGQTDDIYYIALESVEGQSLRDLFRSAGRGNPLPIARALTIAEQTAGALSYAHFQRICHGAIGLDNILVTKHGIAKLAELGFAEALEDSGIDTGKNNKHVTQFTAPEQLQVPPQIEPRTDVYAMGIVLFMMLSGHEPFAARTPEELESKIIKGEHESLMSLRPSLPPDIYNIVEKAISPDPAARFANAGELHRALARIKERYQ